MKTILKIIALLAIVLAIGCKKEFLNAKPDDHLVVPTGLADMQQILDNDKYMNGGKNVFGPVPSFGNASADDYYVPDTYFNSLNDFEKSVYTWATNIPWPSANANWVGPYRTIFYANTALDGLKDIKPTSTELPSYNNIKGSALFYRSFQFSISHKYFANLMILKHMQQILGFRCGCRLTLPNSLRGQH